METEQLKAKLKTAFVLLKEAVDISININKKNDFSVWQETLQIWEIFVSQFIEYIKKIDKQHQLGLLKNIAPWWKLIKF